MKKNVVNKILASALASTFVISMAACGGDEAQSSTPSSSTPVSSSSAAPASSSATAEPAPTEVPGPDMTPLDITVALPSDQTHTEANAEYDRLVSDLGKYLQMNITWEWMDMNSYYEQLGLDIISGDVADVMVVDKSSTFLKAAEEGLFWDLAPYLDEYDNLATIPNATRENASHNGKMYGIPRSRTLARNGLGYRVDWLNNLGLKEPTDWESFYNMLYAFTYNDPDGNGVDDTVGLFLDNWSGAINIILTWFGAPNEWGIDENGDLIHRYMTQEYKTGMAAIRQLYADGVINNGSNGLPVFTDVSAGKAREEGLRPGIGGCGIQVLDDLRKVQTYFEDQGITTADNILFTLQGAVDTGLGTLCMPTTGMNNLVAISTKTIKTEEQLKRVLQMLNDLNDGECMNLIEYGWEGTTYTLDENGYVVLLTDDELSAAGVSTTTYRNGFNQIIPYFTAEENARPVVTAPTTSPIKMLENKLYSENIQYCVPNYGASYSSQYKVENGTALDTIVADAWRAYVKGEIDVAGFEAALDQWWTAGGEIVTKEMNDAYHAAGN